MARQELAVQYPTSAGLTPAYATFTVDGVQISTNENCLVHIKNGNAATVTITLQTPLVVDGLALPDKPITIPTGQERFIRLTRPYIQPDSVPEAGKALVDASPFASVTVAAFM